MNIQCTCAPSAVRTASGNSAELNNEAGAMAHFVIDVTAASGTTPTLVVTIEGFDPVSGKYYTILASVSITATGTTVLRVGPGLTTAANLVANDVMPRLFRVRWTIGGTTPSFTFSIAASLID